MKIQIDIEEDGFSWEDNSYVKVIMPSKNLLEIQANKEGLISLAKQFLTLAYSDSFGGNDIHHNAEAHTENGYVYGDLEEGSLELSIGKVEKDGRKNP